MIIIKQYSINNSNVFAAAVVLYIFLFENFLKVVMQNLHIYNMK